MRYVLIFLLVAAAVMGFILADQFPETLSHYPWLQETNWTVRAWLGMESPYSSRVSEQSLKETEKILQKEGPAKGDRAGHSLQDYHE